MTPQKTKKTQQRGGGTQLGEKPSFSEKIEERALGRRDPIMKARSSPSQISALPSSLHFPKNKRGYQRNNN